MGKRLLLCIVILTVLLIPPAIVLAATPEPEEEPVLGGVIAYPVLDNEATQMIYSIWVVDLETGDREMLLKNASQPSFSYDGKAIAYKDWTEDQDVHGLHSASMDDISGTDWRFGDSLSDQRPKWSPDDAFFYYFSRKESDRENRVMATESIWTKGHTIQRPDMDNKEIWGASPAVVVVKKDTYDILYQGCEFNNCGVMKRHIDGTDRVEVTGSTSDQALAVSPDSESIAFMAYNRDNSWDIYVMDVDGSNVTRLTENSVAEGLPTWSPDGDWIAFVRESAPGSWDIMAIKPDGTGEQKLIELGMLDGKVKGTTPDQFGGWMEEQITWGP
jgi:Tol biopolymer transport system component